MEREKLGSRLGFILLSAGCAIGCGNVWKFPWMCGQYGGGGFVLLYVLCLVVLGLPIMTMEFCVGRAAQTSPIHMYQKLEKKGQKWHIHGYVSLFGSIALMAFYTVVTGWIVYYFVQFLTGNSQNLGFSAMIADPGVNVTYLAVTVAMAFGVLCFGLQSGLERVTKYMMLLLLLLMLVLAVHSFTLDGAAEGLRFYLVPDLSRITGSVVVGAMNQAFFTLSVGMGAMAIFGSYIGKERRLFGEAINVGVLDTCVAFVSGLIIFPSAFAFGVNPGQGPSLIFVTLPNVFNAMPGGQLWGALFFVFLFFAALSTVTAVFENILACWMDRFGISRGRAVLANLVLIFLLSLPCLLGNNLWSGVKALGMGIMDWEDFLVSNNLLPIGSMIYLLFCCVSKKYGWGYDHFLEEANQGRGVRFPAQFRLYFKYVLPVIVLIIFIMGYWDKFKPFIVAALGA